MTRIPIKAAKDISAKYKMDQVIMITWCKKTGKTHVVTYGKTKADCVQAANGGNLIKRKILGWSDDQCLATPSRSDWKWVKTDEELTMEDAKLIADKEIPVYVVWNDEPNSEDPEDYIGEGFAVITSGKVCYYLDGPKNKDCPKVFPFCGSDWEGNVEWVTVYKCMPKSKKDPLDLDPKDWSTMCEKLGLKRVDF